MLVTSLAYQVAAFSYTGTRVSILGRFLKDNTYAHTHSVLLFKIIFKSQTTSCFGSAVWKPLLMPLRTLGNLSFQKEKEEMKGSLQILKKNGLWEDERRR